MKPSTPAPGIRFGSDRHGFAQVVDGNTKLRYIAVAEPFVGDPNRDKSDTATTECVSDDHFRRGQRLDRPLPGERLVWPLLEDLKRCGCDQDRSL